ncbi:MAG: acyl transferase [Bacteroidetes bacterium]|nr:MAG: acyl transferase [Bacteroidota bacterium]
MQKLENEIFQIKDDKDFNRVAIKVFLYQKNNNPVYQTYLSHLGKQSLIPEHYSQIPFLPVEFFKTHIVKSFTGPEEILFTSSGTTGSATSKHFIKKTSLYENAFLKGFEMFYGNPAEYCFLALLPSYLERQGSSLVYMAQKLMKASNHPLNGFYLNDFEKLHNTLTLLENRQQKTILLGVSFALLDFAEKYALPLKHTIVMETGGMKGRRKEITRAELHAVLSKSFGIKDIHSEYGMTELLSQAYSKTKGRFYAPPWMKVLIRDITDPFALVETGKSGGVNIIDLANLYSCSFIATQDIGRLLPNNSFEILGRFDFSDVRGCNLMVV